VIPWRLARGSSFIYMGTQLIRKKKCWKRLVPPQRMPHQESIMQVIENMVRGEGFEPMVSWSRNNENSPKC
jgi:hypothetical protein